MHPTARQRSQAKANPSVQVLQALLNMLFVVWEAQQLQAQLYPACL
jgi:hypothetical protein